MSGEGKIVTASEEPVHVTVVGTGEGGLTRSTVATTPPDQPNIVVNVVNPLMAIGIRFVNSYLVMLVSLVGAGLTTDIIPAGDFIQLVIKCAQLSLATAGLDLLKNLVTIFGRLEGKFPLLTGGV